MATGIGEMCRSAGRFKDDGADMGVGAWLTIGLGAAGVAASDCALRGELLAASARGSGDVVCVARRAPAGVPA